MVVTKALLNTPPDISANATIMVNGRAMPAHAGEWLIEALKRGLTGHTHESHEGGAVDGLASSACVLPEPDGADPELRHVHGEGRWQAGAGLRDAGDGRR